MESHASDWIGSRNYPVHSVPAVYYIQPPVGLGEASFLPTIVEFPLGVASNVGALSEVAASRLPPMPQPLPAWPSTLPPLEVPLAPLSPTLATYRFPPMSTDQLPPRAQPGDTLPPLGQKIPSLLLPPAPSILAPRRSSTGQSLAGHGLAAKGSAKGGKKKAKHACKICCISFTRAHDLKRHNTIHKTDKAFPCPNCSKRFGRRDALKRHLEVRGPNHDDFTKKASAGQPRRMRHAHAHCKESDSFPSPSPSTTDQTQYWDDCGSSGIYLGSGDPSAVSSPIIEVPTEFDWPTGLPSAPATHLDYEKLIGGDQFWQELLA